MRCLNTILNALFGGGGTNHNFDEKDKKKDED